jgi:hypothetical protein
MFIRSKNKQLIKLDVNKFNNEKDLYTSIWKIKYNVTIKNKHISKKELIINYINNDIDFI